MIVAFYWRHRRAARFTIRALALAFVLAVAANIHFRFFTAINPLLLALGLPLGLVLLWLFLVQRQATANTRAAAVGGGYAAAFATASAAAAGARFMANDDLTSPADDVFASPADNDLGSSIDHSVFADVDHGFAINPATGLPMVSGDESGYDVGGNLYGFDDSDHRFDDSDHH